MNFLQRNIKWIMLLSGVFTCSTIYVAIAPHAALIQMFGETVSGSVAEILARDWAVLITLTGLLLIYGAYRPLYRQLIIIFASAGSSWGRFKNAPRSLGGSHGD